MASQARRHERAPHKRRHWPVCDDCRTWCVDPVVVCVVRSRHHVIGIILPALDAGLAKENEALLKLPSSQQLKHVLLQDALSLPFQFPSPLWTLAVKPTSIPELREQLGGNKKTEPNLFPHHSRSGMHARRRFSRARA